MATRLQDEVVVPAEPELYRWPPWQAYRDAAQPATTGAPDVEFVSRAGASRRPFLAMQRIHVLWVSGLYPRALRRRALDVTVAHDGEAAPKRRGVTLPAATASARARRDASGHAESSASGAVDAADVDVTAAPTGAMVSAGARYNVVALRSTAVTAILLKRSVPLAHRAAAKNVRRAGNVASLLLAATAPLRASVRWLVKPRTVAAAVLPMATLRELAQGDGATPQLHTLQLPVFTLPRGMHLATTGALTQYLESRQEDAPGANTAADTSRIARIGAFIRRRCGGAMRDEASAAKRPVIGIVCVRASLQYLRGTTDDGAYDGPERIVVKSVPKGPKAVNRLVANHWVCSHNNIFCVLTAEERATLSPAELALRTPRLYSYYGYGLLGGGAAHAAVHLFGQRRDATPETDVFRYGGRFVTDERGCIEVAAPEDMQGVAGHYALRAVLESDHTVGEGSIFVLEKGTPCVLFDVDGVLNIGDEMMITQMTLDAFWAAQLFDALPQKGVAAVCRAWAAKGYQVVYLSGRQGGFYNLTRRWLVAHGFPPGPIALTEYTLLAALPGEGTLLGGRLELVGAFKRRYLAALLAHGVTFAAAYGNTLTDVTAYTEWLPLRDIYICGVHAGAGGTRPVRDWATHLEELLTVLPEAQPPIPYTNLFF